MTKFHNPYHFVPVSRRTEDDLTVTQKGSERTVDWGRHAHDRYESEEIFTGRLICRLTTEGPVVIGAEQKENGNNQPKTIVPFELNGRPAIPASSLRGMLSSIVEAASNSALRVLDHERPLSSRVIMGSEDVLSAIGMIVKKGEKLHLLPLAMPTMELDNTRYVLPDKFKKVFRENPRMKSYYNGTSSTGEYYYLQSKDWTVDGINANEPGLRHPSEKIYVLKTNESTKININKWKSLPNEEKSKYRQTEVPNKKFLIGQACNQGTLLTAKQWENIQSPIEDYERGFFRVLNDQKVRNSPVMPSTKKHELFIPYPKDIEAKIDKLSVPVSQHAIDTFHALAQERTREQLEDNGELKKDKNGIPISELALNPFHPLGTKRSLDKGKDQYFLTIKDGDLVYFDVNEKGTEVTRVSFSSIWRIDSGRVGDYFPPELLPFNEKRTSITPAELLFGFVQDKAKDKNAALAFKGKVKVSFGQLDMKHESDFYLYKDDPKVLKILGSPKPPCPTLYFKHKPDSRLTGHIAKSALNPTDHAPQGRKEYLRRKLSLVKKAIEDANETPWLTEHVGADDNLNQKVKVTPLKSDLDFWFHIDFENLTTWELALLCFAVQPDTSYRHKIGMGKPLGLGQIQISPVALFKIDRKTRYSSSGLSTSRYNTLWNAGNLLEKLPADLYRYEKEAEYGERGENTFSEFITPFVVTVNKQLINSILVLGNPENVTHDVHTPQVNDQGTLRDIEKESFTWFVENDKNINKRKANSLQQLEPITGNELPALTYIDMTVQHTGGNGGGGAAHAPQGQNHSKGGSQPAPSASKFSGGLADALAKAEERKKR